MTEQGPVLVATETDDATADMVIGELNRRGVPVVRFNPADLQDGTLTVSARFGTCPGVPVAGQVRTPSRTADLTRVRAVYWRRPDWPAYARLGADDARYAAAQARHGLGGTLYSLAYRWVNHPCATPPPTTNPPSSPWPSASACPYRRRSSPTTRTRRGIFSTPTARSSTSRFAGPRTSATASRSPDGPRRSPPTRSTKAYA